MALKSTGKVGELERQAAPVRYCVTVGCEQAVPPGRVKCLTCETRERQERSTEWSEQRGLHTTEQKQAFCRRLSKTLYNRAPSFVGWAMSIQQKTVDLMALHATKGDQQALDRLRDLGVLDSANRLVALDQREAAMKAARERKAKERANLEAELKAKGIVRREIDTEAAT